MAESKKAKFTPGPWEWVKARTMRHLHSATGYLGISQPIGARYESDEYEANAKLIKAAPDMAEALQQLLKAYKQLMPGLVHIAVQDYANINEAPIAAYAALAKAGL